MNKLVFDHASVKFVTPWYWRCRAERAAWRQAPVRRSWLPAEVVSVPEGRRWHDLSATTSN